MSAKPTGLNARLEAIAGLSEDYDQLMEDVKVEKLTAEQFAGILMGYKPPTGMQRAILRERLIQESGGDVKAPAKIVDAWFAEQRGLGDDGGDLQGNSWKPEAFEPWEHPVNLAEVLDEVRAVFEAYVYVSDHCLDALALYTVYTHCWDAFDVAPLLDLSSPAMRCGKSSTLTIIRKLGARTLVASNITPAAVFRCVDAWSPTLMVDEADTFATMNEELRGIVNCGHDRETAFVVRVEGDAREPRMFNTFGPKVVAAIGNLPTTVEDRAIKINLTRKPASVAKANAFDRKAVAQATEATRSRAARAVGDSLAEIEAADFKRPAGLNNDRASDNWSPLLAIASVAGGGWYQRAAEAAVTLSNGSDEVDDSLLALRHVYEALVSAPEGRLTSESVLLILVDRDDGPWAEKWARDLARELDRRDIRRPSAALAKLLKPFGIKPKQLRIDGFKERGYDIEWFEVESVAPFLAAPERDGTAGTAGTAEASNQADVPSVPSVPTFGQPDSEIEDDVSW